MRSHLKWGECFLNGLWDFDRFKEAAFEISSSSSFVLSKIFSNTKCSEVKKFRRAISSTKKCCKNIESPYCSLKKIFLPIYFPRYFMLTNLVLGHIFKTPSHNNLPLNNKLWYICLQFIEQVQLNTNHMWLVLNRTPSNTKGGGYGYETPTNMVLATREQSQVVKLKCEPHLET